MELNLTVPVLNRDIICLVLRKVDHVLTRLPCQLIAFNVHEEQAYRKQCFSLLANFAQRFLRQIFYLTKWLVE